MQSCSFSRTSLCLQLCLTAVVNTSVATAVGQQWTALPRPNTKHLTRQPVYHGTLEGLIACEGAPPPPKLLRYDSAEERPQEDDPFEKFDELCANVDLTVYSNSSSEEELPIINMYGNHIPLLTPGPVEPRPQGALCPVCGELLVSKAALKEHMRSCVDLIMLD